MQNEKLEIKKAVEEAPTGAMTNDQGQMPKEEAKTLLEAPVVLKQPKAEKPKETLPEFLDEAAQIERFGYVAINFAGTHGKTA